MEPIMPINGEGGIIAPGPRPRVEGDLLWSPRVLLACDTVLRGFVFEGDEIIRIRANPDGTILVDTYLPGDSSPIHRGVITQV